MVTILVECNSKYRACSYRLSLNVANQMKSVLLRVTEIQRHQQIMIKSAGSLIRE